VNNAVIVLAGGSSKRLGRDKCLIQLVGKPLILRVIERVSQIVDQTVIVVASNVQRKTLANIVGPKPLLVVDKYDEQGPLIGALTGFESVATKYSMLLPCDAPFVSSEIASLLLDLCTQRNAAIPRWPNGYIEPLQAAYQTKSALEAAREAFSDGQHDLRSMINRMRGVRYVSTMVLKQIDPNLMTFFNVNTPLDEKKAESILKKRLNKNPASMPLHGRQTY
jgi:molybdopterin-guanine dinucleotide biosynthesis protein A